MSAALAEAARLAANALGMNCKDGHDFHKIAGVCNRCNVHASDVRERPRIDPKRDPNKASINFRVAGSLACAIVEVAAEVNARDDTFENMTDAETARKLLAYAIREHRAGRGPWPKPTR